jgi:subtilisin family serine protease
VTTSEPPPAPRAPMVSPVLLSPTIPAAAREAVLTDGDRRAVLIELRVGPGDDPAEVRDDFDSLFRRVFGKGAMTGRTPVPVGRHYLRCAMTPTEIDRLINGGARHSTALADRAMAVIFRVWTDLVVEAHLDRSLTTIQADAASRTFNCGGAGVVWGVLDSGVNKDHPHFAAGKTLTSSAVDKLHRDFTITTGGGAEGSALTDPYGHGTHVAGIIAGHAPQNKAALRLAANEPTMDGLPRWVARELAAGTGLSGVAPNANLVSLRVLDENGKSLQSAVIDALDYVRTINSGGRDLRIHGVNLSLGCTWQPTDFAAGQSPLCRELDLLVGTGVVAVVSAGNIGAGVVGGFVGADISGKTADVYGQLSTITDPGNSAGAITVGSVHRYKPHTYGVTFNSSKGPTLDGRLKPDLVAPGERITSAATGKKAQGIGPLEATPVPKNLAAYMEQSGTSMAAAHVSGVVAAFLSARNEFIGQPQQVKKIFTDSATDIGRHPFYQGAGLVNLMRALTST